MSELADKLISLIEGGDPHMDGSTTQPWPKYVDRPGQVSVVMPGVVQDIIYDAAAELRRLEAENERLRAQVTPIPDADTRQEVEALIDRQTPHVCRSCGGTGWVDDEGWSDERWSRGQIEREEGEGLIPCGACGDWHTYRDEYTAPTTVTDGWTNEQEDRAAELLAAAYLGRTDK